MLPFSLKISPRSVPHPPVPATIEESDSEEEEEELEQEATPRHMRWQDGWNTPLGRPARAVAPVPAVLLGRRPSLRFERMETLAELSEEEDE